MDINEIYLGDAYELIKQIPDKSVDLIITDPPYQIDGVHGKTGIFKYREMKYHKELMADDFRIVSGIDLAILDEFVRVMKKINCYIWCNKEQILPYLEYFVRDRGCNWEMLVWAKQNPTPFCSTHYLKDKEYCLYFWETGAMCKPSFDTAKTVYFTTKNVADKALYGHPTIKPLEIIKNLIENSSGKGSIILDPFIGSGTTAVAAKQLGRNFIGFEISEKYHRIAVDRLKGITQRQKEAGFIQGSLFDQ